MATDHRRDTRLSLSARVRIAGAIGAVLVASSLAVLALTGAPFGHPAVVVSFVLFEGVHWACALRFQPNDDDLVKQFDQAIFVAAFLLLPAAGVVSTFALGVALGFVLLRA